MKVAIAIEDDSVVVPRLSRPEPNPTWSTNKCADKNQQNPHQKAPIEHVEGKTTLTQRVITVAQRIRVDIRKHHQSDHDERRHNDPRDPWIEIDEHLLQTKEIPRRFRRIHR